MKSKFIELYSRFANDVSQLSRGVRLKVGAVAVKDNRIISYGYNGLCPGDDSPLENVVIDDETGLQHLVSKDDVIHAEVNLICKIAKSGESSNGCAVFLTHSPCTKCAATMIQAGIAEIYYQIDYRSLDGVELLKNNGVIVNKIETRNNNE
jgi:dCMP deaminase